MVHHVEIVNRFVLSTVIEWNFYDVNLVDGQGQRQRIATYRSLEQAQIHAYQLVKKHHVELQILVRGRPKRKSTAFLQKIKRQEYEKRQRAVARRS